MCLRASWAARCVLNPIKETIMAHLRNLAPSALALFALTACVAGTEASQHAAQSGALSQFVLGFWQGLIGLITLIGEIINAL